MLVRRFLPLVAFSSLLVTTLGAEIKRERREATFGLVGDLASPFINFKRGILNLLVGGSNAQKPAKQAPKPSYGAPAPSYNAPAPAYNAPAPAYNAPAPSYQAQPPVQAYNAPAPIYNAPAPVYDPPAPKPEIQILPAPDLSQYAPVAAPAVDTYGSPAAAPSVDTYGSPVAAPVVDTYGSPAAAPAVDTYGSPAAAPAVYTYDAPAAAPAVDSYGSPVVPTYVVEQVAPEAPALPPVYEPATYEPAPVEYVPAVEEPVPAVVDVVVPRINANLEEYTVDLTTGAEPSTVNVAASVDLKSAELPAETREPKAFNSEQPAINQLQAVEEKPIDEIIVIDLTDSFSENIITTENVLITTEDAFQTNISEESNEETNEALVIEEDNTNKPVVSQIFTFEAVEELPAISGPVKSSNEVISFSLLQDSEVRNIDFTAVQSEPQVDTFTAAPAVVNVVEETTQSVTTVPEALPTETVTPIVPNQELRSLVVELDSAFLEIADIEAVDFNDVEIIDLRTDKKSSGLTLIDHDEDHPELFVVVDETTTTAVPITTQAQEILDLQDEELAIDVDENTFILTSENDFVLENEVETEQILKESVTTQEPEIRRVTFEILSDEEAKNVSPEITFRIVEPVEKLEENSFDTFRVLETTTAPEDDEGSSITTPSTVITASIGTNPGEIPPAIGSDPVFQEIVKTSEDSDQVKRGYNAYDPRHSQVYAHKYNDKYSNWYYFRKGY